jgi:hypothetical protein
VRVAVVLAGAVVAIMADRFMRSQAFQPVLVVRVQAGFVVVNENRRGYTC